MTENLNIKKRIEWVDVLRGIAILLVLLGHNNPPFIKYIYGFHVPLFFIISGYLYHESKPISHIWKIVKRYYIEYIFICIFDNFLYQLLVLIETSSGTLNWRAILNNLKGILIIKPENLDGCYPLWFLPVLAISEIIFVLIMQIKNKYLKTCIICIVAAFGFAMGIRTSFMPFRIPVAFVGVVFLAVGHFFRRLNVFESKDTKKTKIISIATLALCVVVGFFAIMLNVPNERVNMSDSRFGNIPLFLIGAISWSYAIMWILKNLVTGREETGIFKALKYIGKNTIFIMAFDEITNIIGGRFVEAVMKHHYWYMDFASRILIMALFFVIYKLICKALKNLRRPFYKS